MTPKEPTWRCRNGALIEVSDMTDSHLQNAIRFMRRNASKILNKTISDAYSFESTLSGEMAQMCIEQEIATLEKTEPNDFLETIPEFNVLLEELNKRKLKELPI